MQNYEQMPGHLIRRLQQVAVAVFQAQLGGADCDLTPVQYAALAALKGNPGIDQISLAGEISYDRTTIGGVVERLVRKGLVSRQAKVTDRRARILRLTPEGEHLLETITPKVEAAQEILLSGLDGAESERFLDLLKKALEAVKDHARAPKRRE